MSKLVVPYPPEPERRQRLFDMAVSKIGSGLQGTPDAGSFDLKIPLGAFVGRYRSVPGSNEIEILIDKKPMFIPTKLIESEARRAVANF